MEEADERLERGEYFRVAQHVIEEVRPVLRVLRVILVAKKLAVHEDCELFRTDLA